MLVLLSPTVPESDPATRASPDGTELLTVLISTDNALETAEVLPAVSVAVAVKECVPVDRVPVVICQVPEPEFTVGVNKPFMLEVNAIVLLLPSEPLIINDVLLVLLSEFEKPESLVASKSNAVGADGATVSIERL